VSRGLQALTAGSQEEPIEIVCIGKGGLEKWLTGQSDAVKAWIGHQFKAKDGEVCIVPGPSGGIDHILLGIDDSLDIWAYAALPSKLIPGTYSLSGEFDGTAAALGWAVGTYSFERYKTKKEGSEVSKNASLIWPEGSDRAVVCALAEGIFLARDMITTPAEDMGG